MKIQQQQQASALLDSAAATSNNTLLGRFLSSLTHEFVHGELLPWLPINDITRLGQVSRHFRAVVTSSRTSYPHIIWEGRRPTQIGYESFSRCRYEDEDDNDTVASVAQVQPFRFIMLTAAHEYAQVNYSLINGVWDEHGNNRDGEDCRDSCSFPMETRPQIDAFLPKKSNQNQCDLFSIHPPGSFQHDGGYLDCSWVSSLGNGYDSRYFEGSEKLTPGEVEKLKDALDLMWKCSNLIAVYPDGIAYPSAEYLMQILPPWLHEYFPSDLSAVVALNHYFDRETAVELNYRPAPTLEVWEAFIPPIELGVHIHDVQDLPWYRNENPCESRGAKRQKIE